MGDEQAAVDRQVLAVSLLRVKSDISTSPGVLCLIPQTVMMILSLEPIRNRYYETFKTSVFPFGDGARSSADLFLPHRFHFILAMVFIVTLFIHCDSILTSW